MNQPTTYEQLIAQKLQELPVPDQAGTIWATIEQQLNIEMPTNGPGSGGPGKFKWWIGKGGLFTLIVAVVTYILISKQNPENERTIKEKPASVKQQPAITTADSLGHPLPPIGVKENKPGAVTDAQVQQPEVTGQPAMQDSTKSTPVQKEIDIPAVLPPQSVDTVTTKKKSRGVKGISDADYRLVPSPKDSTKRKN